MDSYTLVRPEHLNHHGFLFGGQLLKWVDELAWLCATRTYPKTTLVTVGMDKIHFRHRVANGAILRFQIEVIRLGTTSITCSVNVYADSPGETVEDHVFDTQVTFVNINPKGDKTPLAPSLGPSLP
jgi:acyl-CoA hydrolase